MQMLSCVFIGLAPLKSGLPGSNPAWQDGTGATVWEKTRTPSPWKGRVRLQRCCGHGSSPHLNAPASWAESLVLAGLQQCKLSRAARTKMQQAEVQLRCKGILSLQFQAFRRSASAFSRATPSLASPAGLRGQLDMSCDGHVQLR